ncbi:MULTISPECIES: CPCC family cysteine-rich protein [Acinetobacter]|uniref:Cysteine-rich CPCC domain-containing protein n=1 Tax=Acinetobacter piscicola TaxID=2006115 RepID=A0A7S6VY74_9GAMM|nr:MULTISPECIES: CPCC family cysteine-rich protein [Acinetobacter]QOW46995.1 hypothetical protein G0028_14470 [Acinetobacter piscicola]
MNRKSVANEIAKKAVLDLSVEERNALVLSVWHVVDQQDIDEGFDVSQIDIDYSILEFFLNNEFDDDMVYGEFFTPAIVYMLSQRYLLYNNMKLKKMYKILYCEDICISEDSRDFFSKCKCCGFYTLPLEPDFEACGLCLWQDEGKNDYDFSPVNGMTIIEYREIFFVNNAKAKLEKLYISDNSI